MKKPIVIKACGATGLADALGAAMTRKLSANTASLAKRMGVPNPLIEKRRREENANRIAKHSSIIKRQDPRLLQELLQQFGSLEGLSAPRQEELLKRLEQIRKDYRL